jgi:hypothetical protein
MDFKAFITESDDKITKLGLGVRNFPQQPQRQDSTDDQLRDLRVIANRLGMYDAADVIRTLLEKGKKK